MHLLSFTSLLLARSCAAAHRASHLHWPQSVAPYRRAASDASGVSVRVCARSMQPPTLVPRSAVPDRCHTQEAAAGGRPPSVQCSAHQHLLHNARISTCCMMPVECISTCCIMPVECISTCCIMPAPRPAAQSCCTVCLALPLPTFAFANVWIYP